MWIYANSFTVIFVYVIIRLNKLHIKLSFEKKTVDYHSQNRYAGKLASIICCFLSEENFHNTAPKTTIPLPVPLAYILLKDVHVCVVKWNVRKYGGLYNQGTIIKT